MALGARKSGTKWRTAANLVEALVEIGKYEATSVRPHVDAAIQGLVVGMKCPPGMMRIGSAMPALREVVTLYDDAVCKVQRGNDGRRAPDRDREVLWREVAERSHADGGRVTGAISIGERIKAWQAKQ